MNMKAVVRELAEAIDCNQDMQSLLAHKSAALEGSLARLEYSGGYLHVYTEHVQAGHDGTSKILFVLCMRAWTDSDTPRMFSAFGATAVERGRDGV
jgi:hypothetical protein